jgi:hypothetical protein
MDQPVEEPQKMDFLSKLQFEAQMQARLHSNKVLPDKLDSIAAFVGNYPWQVLAVLSGLTAFGLEALNWIKL